MNQTTYHVDKMDCAAEERLVRMHLEGADGVRRLAFDLPARRLDVIHTGDRTPITEALVGKTLSGGRLEGRDKVTPVGCPR